MKKARNILLALLCALLLIAGSVAGTLAYLTSGDTVTNTFTVGDVEITMDEAPVNKETGKAETGARVKGYTDVLLIPGRTIDKDPTVHVTAESETCWVFVEVTNGLAGIEDATKTVHDQILANGWTLLETGVYYRVVEKNATPKDFVVFSTFTVDAEVDNDTLADYDGDTITVVAYAIQKENVADAETAWDLVKS